MQAQKNKQIIDRYLTELNSGQPKDQAFIDRYISDKDKELKNHIQVFEASFPGYRLDPKEMIAEDDKISVSFVFKGTHKADFNGIPATNKEVSIPGFISYHLEDGKIVAHDMVVDSLKLMQQLGVVPEMA